MILGQQLKHHVCLSNTIEVMIDQNTANVRLKWLNALIVAGNIGLIIYSIVLYYNEAGSLCLSLANL